MKNFETELKENSLKAISKERFLKLMMTSSLVLIAFFFINFIDLFLETNISFGQIVATYIFMIIMVIGYFVFFRALEKCQKQYKIQYIKIFEKYNKI